MNYVDWEAMGTYTENLSSHQATDVIDFAYDWTYDGHQKSIYFAKSTETRYPVECGEMEFHMHLFLARPFHMYI